MPEICTVRKLSLDDATALAPLRREALETHPLAFGSVVPDDPGQLIDFFRHPLTSEESEIFGAVVNGALVGMVGVRRDKGGKARHKALVWGMYVRSAFRRTGAGEKLLRAAIEQARSWPGVDQLHLAVSEIAEDARKLYARLGFREWGREPRALCWEGRYVDESHMVLGLGRRVHLRIEMLQPDMARVVRPEVASDRAAIAEISDRAFGGATESAIVEAIRASGRPIISLVATFGSAVVGHIFFSPVEIESAGTPLMSFGLGPMAVLPEFQRQGIGSDLVEAGLTECARQGGEVVVVLGHVHFYPRFGFQPARLFQLNSEYAGAGDAFMALELVKDALSGRSGIVRYLPEFGNAQNS